MKLYEHNLFNRSAIVGRHLEVGNLVLACGSSGHGMMYSSGLDIGASELILHGACCEIAGVGVIDG